LARMRRITGRLSHPPPIRYGCRIWSQKAQGQSNLASIQRSTRRRRFSWTCNWVVGGWHGGG
jgi:hypothetical protein